MDKKIGYCTNKELENLGLKGYGKNVLISKTVRIIHPHNVLIGNNVRIDDFCIFTGKVEIGNYVHIAPFCLFSGRFGIKIKDFVGISTRVSIYTNNEDYSSGSSLSTASIPDYLHKTEKGEVVLGEHSLVGAHCIILPSANLQIGVSVGALSLVKEICEEWSLYAGIPAKKIKKIPNNIKLRDAKKLLKND